MNAPSLVVVRAVHRRAPPPPPRSSSSAPLDGAALNALSRYGRAALALMPSSTPWAPALLEGSASNALSRCSVRLGGEENKRRDNYSNFSLFYALTAAATKKKTIGDRHCMYYLIVRAVMIANFTIDRPAPLEINRGGGDSHCVKKGPLFVWRLAVFLCFFALGKK